MARAHPRSEERTFLAPPSDVMAVYTDVSGEELAAFLADYDCGAMLSLKGIAEGVENSNYLLHAERAISSSRSTKSA